MARPLHHSDRQYLRSAFKKGDTAAQLIAWSGFTEDQVWRALDGMIFGPRRMAGWKPETKPKAPPINEAAVVALWMNREAERLTVREIADRVGCSHESAYKVLRKLSPDRAPGARFAPRETAQSQE